MGNPEEEILEKQCQEGIPSKESSRKNPSEEILEEGSWKRNPEKGTGTLWSHQEIPGVTRTTFWAERKSVLKPLCFSEESGATDLLACTGARRHAPSTAPEHKS